MLLQVYLQEYAWTEEQKPGAVADRADHAAHAAERSLLTREPMFCFQTALALHRWSCLTYMGAQQPALKEAATAGLQQCRKLPCLELEDPSRALLPTSGWSSWARAW